MTAFANSLTTNIIVTILMLLMVFLLPWLDRRICRRLGLNLQGGVSANPQAERLLRMRRILLYAVFGLYLLAVAYIVFFSRSATKDYQVHIALFSDLKNAVRIDFGFLGFIKTVFTDGFRVAASHVRIEKAEDIAQVYMNVMLFVPMGYLLPYLFGWFRAKVRCRPALACFIIALLIENLQLIFRRQHCRRNPRPVPVYFRGLCGDSSGLAEGTEILPAVEAERPDPHALPLRAPDGADAHHPARL